MNIRSSLTGLALAVALLLGGCGPNGGGTGTGDAVVTLSDFNASAASTCSAPFATALDCDVVVTDVADASSVPGTDAVLFGGSAASGPFLLRVQGNRATLESRCGPARFEGTWGRLPDGQARFFGQWQAADGSSAVLAQLAVQELPGGLLVSVLDGDARGALLGPLLLQRLAVEPIGTAGCP